MIYITVFYLDKKFSKEEKREIEERLKKRTECTAAIYDCSYYIYITNTLRERLPRRRISLRGRESVLRDIFTEHYFKSTDSGFLIAEPIMSDSVFSSIKKEIYEFTLRDSGAKIEIINFREFEQGSVLGSDGPEPDIKKTNK